MTRTIQGIIGNCIHSGTVAGRDFERARAADDVLDIVRLILYQVNSHNAKEALVDSLREPMERVDDS